MYKKEDHDKFNFFMERKKTKKYPIFKYKIHEKYFYIDARQRLLWIQSLVSEIGSFYVDGRQLKIKNLRY